MHHANLLIGTKEWTFEEVPCDCTKETPDICIRVYERMSIKDVRDLIHESSLKPVTDDVRIFVLYIDKILHEAQNALLKLFEEPNETTVFYVGVADEGMLLPTLRSRFMLFGREQVQNDEEVLKSFLKLACNDRLLMIAEKVKEGDETWIQGMVRGLSQYAHQKKEQQLTKDVLMLEKYIKTNGASKKMLLEHVALSI